jgi:pyrroline-5-carboxylate reductase
MVKFGMIGGGMMGEALISRLLAQNVYHPGDVIVSDPLPARRAYLANTYQVQVTAENGEVAIAETLLLAIKPQVFETVTQALLPTLAQQSVPTLVLSILAGTPLAKLEAAFPQRAVVRAMPNTPATVGAGMTAIAPGRHATLDHIAQAERIFAAVGEVVQVPEGLMDAVTGLSGSGPGYIALVVEALTDGGVAVGLPRAIAAKLAVQTVKGSAQLLQEKDLHPAILKDQVTSPGGTTIAGISHLEQSGFRSALIEAVRAAYQRSQELGQ